MMGDLEAALRVASDALRRHAAAAAARGGRGFARPVIVIDDLGEGDAAWLRSREGDACLQRLLQWCVYVTKEHRLAHVILTGNEQLGMILHLVLKAGDARNIILPGLYLHYGGYGLFDKLDAYMWSFSLERWN